MLDVLFRDHRDGASAQAFFERTLGTTGQQPDEVITDHHQPYVKAVATSCPAAKHTRTGLHRARGGTTKPIERSHVPTRDRLRSSRGLKTLASGQRFFEGFEALQALHRGHVYLRDLVPDYDPRDSMTPHVHARAVVVAVNALGARLRGHASGSLGPPPELLLLRAALLHGAFGTGRDQVATRAVAHSDGVICSSWWGSPR